jgi:Uma2 family endonuclease
MTPAPLQRKKAERFTWQDYRSWSEGERWELLDGVPYAMSPAPVVDHQKVTGRLYARLDSALAGKPCQPLVAPTDVHLSDLDVVQPDVFVVCKPEKILRTHIEGAPEVVVEVLSPSTAVRDLREKKALYERFGVLEYVVVHPEDHYAIRFLLDPATGHFDAGTLFAADETLVIATLENLEVPLWEVFQMPFTGAEKPPVNGPPRT